MEPLLLFGPSFLVKRRLHHSPPNRPDVWSYWTSPHGPGSGQRHVWAHAWLLGSCGTAGGCCSDTKRSGGKNPTQIGSVLIGPHGLQHLCSCVSYLRRGRVKSAADRPVTVLTGKVPIFKHFTASREEKWKHCDALYFVKLCFGIFVTLTCLRANKL